MPSSSPARDGGATGTTNGIQGKEKEPNKPRKLVTLNENLLLGPTGFPDLISELKDFKVKGKGHEVEDLTRLMRVYNFWAHRLHPKLKFRDTVLRVEKLCHSKRMQASVALSVWRDEANGKMRDLDADLSLDSDDDDREPVNQDKAQPREGIPLPRPEVRSSSTLPSPRASSQPPTNGSQDHGDLFGPSTSNLITSTMSATSSSTPANRRTIVDDDDDEENLWKQLEEARTLHPAQSQQPPTSSGDVDDEEMWAALDEPSASIQPATRVTSGGADEMDIDDDDIWDIIKENEKSPPPSSSGGEEANPTIPVHVNQSLSESEMGWEDMYAD
ncbi:hypothetical protein AGABI2DRAFT_115101 [Agaricus bisporus var. bisporus H97]|uniref:hypothetical protein n=1 Tax=Agaricus bisporus var. bisporus (strain H97 / ATCC MYA-4626 / FGSC 10389) TaxID=936046 RepID=UPI00029F5591|nr:hypothetical protein AGABI2DRAFT_115101 [Agaricus bisporus var. bisporus H97]EKV50035.1 hypothetical protein AGABI2DRAFT_115101 [Agaricus bisporus var. bisporus H97]